MSAAKCLIAYLFSWAESQPTETSGAILPCGLSHSCYQFGDQRSPACHPTAWHLLNLLVLPLCSSVVTLVKTTVNVYDVFLLINVLWGFLDLYTSSSSDSLICCLILNAYLDVISFARELSLNSPPWLLLDW